MRFRCKTCDELHEGMPSFGWKYPIQYLLVPEAERESRCSLTSDTCIIDDEHFFVRGCLEIPVRDEQETLSWGVWTSLSAKHFDHFVELFGVAKRAQHGPFFGWLAAAVRGYPDTVNLKTMVHLRDDGIRPYAELEPTDHPLAVEQREGITVERAAEIFAMMTHAADGAG